ncbi:MAG: hypothetical protein IIB66_13385, partial [Proteobacteria bacterium]|nr:hypothetical protein [Pseudomonadota bacterium]
MNRLACHVCQQQFKNESGLSWHLDRIHDRPVGDVRFIQSDPCANSHDAYALGSARIHAQSSFEEADDEVDSREIEMESLRAKLMEKCDRFLERITGLSHEMEEVKHRLRDAEKSALTVEALSVESARRSDRN